MFHKKYTQNIVVEILYILTSIKNQITNVYFRYLGVFRIHHYHSFISYQRFSFKKKQVRLAALYTLNNQNSQTVQTKHLLELNESIETAKRFRPLVRNKADTNSSHVNV